MAFDESWLRGIASSHVVALIVLLVLWRIPRFFSSLSNTQTATTPTKTTLSRNETTKDKKDEPLKSTIPQVSISTEDDAFIQDKVPESTPEERARFFTCLNGDKHAASRRLKEYVDWHCFHEEIATNDVGTTLKPCGDADHDCWNKAAAVAMQSQGYNKNDSIVVELPRVARTHYHNKPSSKETTTKVPSPSDYVCDLDGIRVVHFIPGRMDDRLCNAKTYALAIALYLNYTMDRNSMEQITLVVDARGGRGWRNRNAVQLIPFMQQTLQLLVTMFPQRMHRSLVFPIPSSFLWVWRLVRQCLDESTRDRVQLLAGTATIASPPPLEEMAIYLGVENAQLLEMRRKEAFVDEASAAT